MKKKGLAMRSLLLTTLTIGLYSSAVLADPSPPPDAKPLSEILKNVEARPDFGYFDEIEWDEGSYEVEFYTKAGAKMKVHIDPVSGGQRP